MVCEWAGGVSLVGVGPAVPRWAGALPLRRRLRGSAGRGAGATARCGVAGASNRGWVGSGRGVVGEGVFRGGQPQGRLPGVCRAAPGRGGWGSWSWQWRTASFMCVDLG